MLAVLPLLRFNRTLHRHKIVLQRFFTKARTIGEERGIDGRTGTITARKVTVIAQTAACFAQQDVACGGIPLTGGGRKFGVDVGMTFGDGAELEGAAATDVVIMRLRRARAVMIVGSNGA